jgi:hypothetical protein
MAVQPPLLIVLSQTAPQQGCVVFGILLPYSCATYGSYLAQDACDAVVDDDRVDFMGHAREQQHGFSGSGVHTREQASPEGPAQCFVGIVVVQLMHSAVRYGRHKRSKPAPLSIQTAKSARFLLVLSWLRFQTSGKGKRHPSSRFARFATKIAVVWSTLHAFVVLPDTYSKRHPAGQDVLWQAEPNNRCDTIRRGRRVMTKPCWQLNVEPRCAGLGQCSVVLDPN